MRISSGFLGIFGFVVLIVGTAICALTSYDFTRSTVVDLWDKGFEVESPLEVVQALTNPEDFKPVPTATRQSSVYVIPSATPFPAAIITQPTAAAQSVATQAQVVPQPTTLATLDPAADYRWADPRQIRILLMGIDERVGYDSENAYRTDTMILVNVDPVRKTAGVISFPRDLWVTIPDYESARINSANYLGDLNAYPGGGGPALAMETIRSNFGIPVDYYVMVNFSAFERVVDILAPGGVPIEVEEYIDDPKYPNAGYGTVHVRFEPGLEMMSGERLLQYARTRASAGGDFDRARRQQQTLETLRETALSAGGIQNFITQIGTLWDELKGSFRTNLTLDEIIGLGFLLGEIPRDNISYIVLGEGYSQPGQTPSGDFVLYPIFSVISDAIQRVFYPEISVTVADLQLRAQPENANIRVFNGTDILGLAGRTEEWLTGRGVVIVEINNIPNPVNAPTTINNYGGARNTAFWLATLLDLPPERIKPGTDGLAATGVIVVVGPDIEAILDGG